MGGTASMIYSGAVEAAAGMIVGSAVSSVASTYEMQEELGVNLYSLQQELIKIQCVINVARRRRITDQKLLEWLAQIINALYLGTYYYCTSKHRNSLPLMIESEHLAIGPSNRAAKRQRTIRTTLFGDDEFKRLCDVLRTLKSIDMCAFILMVNAQPERPMKTYLYMDHNRLSNRDKEIQQVINFLFEPSKVGGNNVSILPIVGPWGGGKTSLALHCFHDPKVHNHFPLKIYTTPSKITHDNTDGCPTIFRDILEKCNSTQITNDENTLLMLKHKLQSERFLLMIDYLCGMDPMDWNDLWDCLKCGKQGSKVIFVSSIDDYESYKETINPEAAMPVMVDGFSEDEYMLFFNEHAFGGADPEDYPELAGMGREIAKKMNGSIWGAKILGELLRDNLTAPFWSNFLQAGFLSPLQRGGKDIWPVIQTMSLLLPKSLQLCGLEWCSGPVEYRHEVKTFRELIVLGPNHCTTLIKDGNYCGVRFLASEHVYLNRCTAFVANCKPFGDKSTIVLEDSN